MIFNKYLHYLRVKHDWNHINCLTLIEDIYDRFLGVNFNQSYKRLNVDKNKTTYSRRWFYSNFTKEFLEVESKYWVKITLTDLKEFDILVFVDKKERPNHFGCYIAQNKFIHIQEHQFATIELLNEDWREQLQGVYRYVV